MPLTAVILAGGLGTRIQGVLPDTPKALALINGQPFITILLNQLLDAGVSKVVLCTGHLGEQIEQRLGARFEAMSITYSIEREILGTAGALRNALPKLTSEKVLVMNGDSCVNVMLKPFIDRYATQEDRGAIFLTWVDDCSRFGTVETDEDDNLLVFREKDGHSRPGWINAGVYILPTSWISRIPTGVPVSLEREVLPVWSRSGIGAFKCKAGFIDIGTPESLEQAGSFFAD
jgi:NDP-sugar pyrophosphorylase family protein